MSILDPNDPHRRNAARARRHAAADLAFSRPHPTQVANSDEDDFGEKFPMNFTKGLPHDPNTGLISRGADYRQFVKAIFSGDQRDFLRTSLGPEGAVQSALTADGVARLRARLIDSGLPDTSAQVKAIDAATKAAADAGIEAGVGLRAWESQSAGLAFDLEGPDAQAVTMPPAPGLGGAKGNDELTAELAEVYAQALLRDVPFKYLDGSVDLPVDPIPLPGGMTLDVRAVLDALNSLRNAANFDGFDNRIVGHIEARVPETIGSTGDDLTLGSLFRGITPGDLIGPYLSQFLLIGNPGVNKHDLTMTIGDGKVSYGAIRADMKVRYALPCVDYLTTWEEWYAVQCAASVGNLEIYADQVPPTAPDPSKVDYRFITTPRDLSTYVHYDALYEAYLNAGLYLLGRGADFDPGLPFLANDAIDHQQGFAHFGGPHLLSLVTEVATRALKCVRFQKFNVHRRLRPEALAARMERLANLPSLPNDGDVKFGQMHHALQDSGLLDLVRAHNAANNGGEESVLLPLAFTEGSPMHPTYGAGHATVAGACVTVLKAFFDGTKALFVDEDNNPKPDYYVPCIDDEQTGESSLALEFGDEALTIEDELNKLAANISIGRDWAGVHYYSDYVESLRMGEEIAIGILKEQKLMFQEAFHMSFTSFDGIPISI